MNKKFINMFKKVGMHHFYGDYFDARFYVAYLLSKMQTNTILDVGCGAGVMLHCTNATLKIGLDASLESLKHAKLLDPTIELIQGDATQLPFKDNYFSLIIAMHLVPVVHLHRGDDWLKTVGELKRVSSTDNEIILTGANRMSKHFEKTHPIESRKKYLTYKKQIDFFQDDFKITVEGFGPHPKKIMFALKILYKFPDQFLEKIGITKLVYRFLRSKRYLKNGRSYVIICKRSSN